MMETIDIINPATGELVRKVPMVSREQVGRALEDAQAAWEPWRRLPA